MEGYKIVICGVRPGCAEVRAAESLSLLLKHPAEQLLPALRSKQPISLTLRGPLLTAARGLREQVEGMGRVCTLASLAPLPPKAALIQGDFGHLNLRRFANTAVGLALDAPGYWRDLSENGLFRIPRAAFSPTPSPKAEKPRTHVGGPADATMENALRSLRFAYDRSARALRGRALESVKAACPEWMKPQDPLFRIFEIQEFLLKEGKIIWAALVQANRQLFSPGLSDCPAELAWSDDAWFDARPAELRGIAHNVFRLKSTAPSSPEERKIADKLTDELTRSFKSKLPESLTDKNVYTTSFMVFRKHILNGTLHGAKSFPILTHPSARQVMIVPCEFWPMELVGLWKNGQL